jgi:hypothetical protein
LLLHAFLPGPEGPGLPVLSIKVRRGEQIHSLNPRNEADWEYRGTLTSSYELD